MCSLLDLGFYEKATIQYGMETIDKKSSLEIIKTGNVYIVDDRSVMILKR